jgi:hypothetical protein
VICPTSQAKRLRPIGTTGKSLPPFTTRIVNLSDSASPQKTDIGSDLDHVCSGPKGDHGRMTGCLNDCATIAMSGEVQLRRATLGLEKWED